MILINIDQDTIKIESEIKEDGALETVLTSDYYRDKLKCKKVIIGNGIGEIKGSLFYFCDKVE